MSSKDSIKRIISDIIEFQKDTPDNIYIDVDKTNIESMKALIVGPKATPYEDGYYFFDIKFPKNYPHSPPKVQLKTIDGKIRLNPNLYACGKVCLSILGTWSGPSWTSALTLKSVLLSIQTLMNEFPIKNEPGFEKIKNDSDNSINFNNFVRFYKYKLTIIDVLNNKFPEFSCFMETIKKDFKSKSDNHINNLLSLAQIYNKDITYQSPIYFVTNFKTPYEELLKNILELKINKVENNIVENNKMENNKVIVS